MPASAADIPTELLPLILEYLGTNANGERDGLHRKKTWQPDLLTCSLVCVDWANRLRPVLFPNMSIGVRSMERMKALNFYGKHASLRLVRIADIIDGWGLSQPWASRSWCHLRYPSPFCAKIPHVRGRTWADGLSLTLHGPVPDGLPVSVLHSPHWSLPRSLPACYTPFTRLHLYLIHFPSFSSLVKLLRHFKALNYLGANRVTWTEDDTYRTSPVATSSEFDVVARRCADNRRVCTLARIVFGRFSSFGRLRAQERDACLALLQPVPRLLPPHNPLLSVDGSHPLFTSDSLQVTCRSPTVFRITQELRDEGKDVLRLDLYVLTNGTSPQPLSVVALRLDATIRSHPAFEKCRLASLTHCVDRMASLRLVALSFASLADMEHSVSADPTLRTPLVVPGRGGITYRFLCQHRQRRPIFADIPTAYGYYDTLVEIDPVTVQPTGRVWDGREGNRDALLGQMVSRYHPGLSF